MAFQCLTTCSNFVLNIRFWVSSLQCLCLRETGSFPQTGYLNWFGTARVKEQGHRTTASFSWAVAFYAFLDNRWNMPVLVLYPWRSKEIQCRNSRFPVMENILETITHAGILEQNSTYISRSQFMTVSRVNRGLCEEKSC